MSLYGALFSGVSGLAAQSQAMGMISDNISNVNTVGYKKTRADFNTLVTQAATATLYSPGGVQSRPNLLIDQQGLLQSSASDTDLAISGDGFFVVNTVSVPTAATGEYMFTRAGSFTPDKDGDLLNAAGFYVQAWPIDPLTGAIPSNRTDLTQLETVNISGLTGTAVPSTTVSLAANLQSSQAINPAVSGGTYVVGDLATDTLIADFERTLQIFDSQGGSRSLTFSFLKDSTPNRWLTEIFVEPATDADAGAHPNGLVANGTLAFNTDGTFDLGNSSAALFNLGITWDASLGVANSTVTVDYGTDAMTDGMTQFDSASQLGLAETDGSVFGALSRVTVDDDGVVTALFDNGTQRDIYKLPVAIFPNPNGLGNRTGNAFIATIESGSLNMQEAGIGGAGLVAPSALEASTVDLAEEFTNMIITQRAFSASGRIITTADEMLEELILLRR